MKLLDCNEIANLIRQRPLELERLEVELSHLAVRITNNTAQNAWRQDAMPCDGMHVAWWCSVRG